MEHSPTFRFSSANRWVKCNGSITLCKDLEPEEETQAAKEGTAAHWVGESMLVAFRDGDDDYFKVGSATINQAAPNGVIITDELFDCALTYANEVARVIGSEMDRRSTLMIEVKVNSAYIDPEAYGTNDSAFYDILRNTLHVWDFKAGHGAVDPKGNYQLIGYAQSICEMLNYARINPRLELHIVQPRCYDGKGAVRTWTVQFDHLRAYINDMKHAVQGYRMNITELVTGPWCKGCRAECPSLTQAAANGIDYSMTTTKQNMTSEALAYEKKLVDDAIKRLEVRKISVDTQIESRVRKGELIPGYRMQDKLSNKKWKSENAKEIIILGELLGVETKKAEDVITVSQTITKLKAKGIDESVIAPYYERQKTGVKLVPDDNTRAQSIFSTEKL